MNRSMAFVRSGRRHVATLFFLLICWPIASAEEVSIQASFKPDSGNPQRNKFINDTPSSGYCASNPSECRDNEMFSLQVPIQFDSNGPILANHDPHGNKTAVLGQCDGDLGFGSLDTVKGRKTWSAMCETHKQ